jgi:hypothetical protein
MGVVDAASYTIRGSISTKSFSMIFPILTVMYVQRMNRRPMYYGIAIVLFITSLVKIGAFYQQSYVIGDRAISSNYQEVDPSARWLQAHATKPHYTILADLNLYGKYLVKSVYDQHEPIVEGYTLDQFENVIGASDGLWNTRPDIVATDIRSSEPIIGFVWLLFEPLHNFTTELRQNQHMHIIYDDGSIWLGKPLQG